MKTKLTKREKTAQALCQSIRESVTAGGSYPVEVEWTRSATWGANPQIRHRGERCVNVSGCGYCKLSTALAECLRFLAEDEAGQHRIWAAGGSGESGIISRLAEAGWNLVPVCHGKSYDVYTLSRKT